MSPYGLDIDTEGLIGMLLGKTSVALWLCGSLSLVPSWGNKFGLRFSLVKEAEA